MPGSIDFIATYGIGPTYELFEDDPVPDTVPEMREAFPGSINAQGSLTNDGEVAILYQWDQASDLVVDLDYVLWGDKAESVDKTGISIDGPDVNVSDSAFEPDTPQATQDVIATSAHAAGAGWGRVDLTEGTENDASGNGVTGHDETSENLSATFDERTASPGAPTAP